MKAQSRGKLTSRFSNRKSSPRSKRQLVWVSIAVGVLLLYGLQPSDDLTDGLDQTQLQELVNDLAQTRKQEEMKQRALSIEQAAAPLKQDVKQNPVSANMGARAAAVAITLPNGADFGSMANIAKMKPADVPLKNQSFGIIHLGKCGGVSMREALVSYIGRQTVLGKAVARSKWYHLAKPEVDLFRNWMILVRNPISRLQSWWMYDHPDNFPYRQDYLGFPYRSKMWPMFFECYPTLDEFLIKGLAPVTEVSTQDICKMLALMALPLRGSAYITGFQHLRFNFDRYLAPLMASKEEEKFFVVRAESMLDDLNGINKMLGGESDESPASLPAVPHVSHWRTKDYPNRDRSMSAAGLENLCRHLCNEIQHYKHVLARGVNLSLQSAATSMQTLAKSCPMQVSSNECPLGMTEEQWNAMEKQLQNLSSKETQQIHTDMIAYREEVRQNSMLPKSQKLQLFRSTDLDDKFGFLHLGRTGGRTVKFLLSKHTETALHQKMNGGTWSSTGKPLMWKHRHWVIMVRDPIERLMSWWTYHHPANLERRADAAKIKALPEHMRAEWKFFYDCFPSLQELALDGIQEKTQKYPNEYRKACRQVAQRAIPLFGTSKIPLMNEIDFSYTEHKRDFEDEGKERFFFVVRMEQMVADLNGIEQMLTRKESEVFEKLEAREFKGTIHTKYWPETDPELSSKARTVLCARLCGGIQVYKNLLKAGINLTEKSYQLAMDRLVGYCPLEVEKNIC